MVFGRQIEFTIVFRNGQFDICKDNKAQLWSEINKNLVRMGHFPAEICHSTEESAQKEMLRLVKILN